MFIQYIFTLLYFSCLEVLKIYPQLADPFLLLCQHIKINRSIHLEFYFFCWNTEYCNSGFYITYHYTSRTHNSSIANLYVGKNGCTGMKGHIIAY